MKFQEGDRVKCISKKLTDWEGTPIWGGEFGEVVGTIHRITKFHYGGRTGSVGFEVDWDNGQRNGLFELSDLESMSIIPEHLFEI